MLGGVVRGRERSLAQTDIHDVLRNERRRLVLERLREGGGPQTVSDLAEHIAAVESGESPPPRNVRQSVYVSLHQTHLPKLDSLDIVSYDDEDNDVRLSDHAEEVSVYLEVVPRYGLSWAEFYLGVTVLGGLLLLAQSVGVPGVSGVPTVAIAALSLLLVAAPAVYQIVVGGRSIVHRLRR
jgi:hypothetical protein